MVSFYIVSHLPKADFAGGSNTEILHGGGIVFGKNFYGFGGRKGSASAINAIYRAIFAIVDNAFDIV